MLLLELPILIRSCTYTRKNITRWLLLALSLVLHTHNNTGSNKLVVSLIELMWKPYRYTDKVNHVRMPREVL